MSRIGNMPITVPAGVTVTIGANNEVTVKGPKGELKQSLPEDIILEQNGDTINVKRPSEIKKHKSLHGLTRTLLNNMSVQTRDSRRSCKSTVLVTEQQSKAISLL